MLMLQTRLQLAQCRADLCRIRMHLNMCQPSAARGLSFFPIIPTILAPRDLKTGSSAISSGVDPLFERNITGSITWWIPKSPCTASDG